MRFEYDKIGDILYIETVEPYAEQESDELDDEIVARYNPKTGALESLEILWFMHRVDQGAIIEVPVDAFKLAV